MQLRYQSPVERTLDYLGEICSNPREIINSVLERRFMFTKVGREYLVERGTSVEEVTLSYRGSLEDYCNENRMVKGIHYTASEVEIVGATYHKEAMRILDEMAKLGIKKSTGRKNTNSKNYLTEPNSFISSN